MNPAASTISAAYTAPSGRPLRAGPVKHCPSCHTPLDGGPVRFRCYPCGTPVMAADLDTEYRPHRATGHADDGTHTGANPSHNAPEGRPIS
ncbi:hypothetical protein ACGFNU_23380 [Spirillospora sp. NPDC048911]|uniref:hypothetical protein n=1 Tax=Spirillospora sp. NPDC048911 TaxID=3364527 RepID=UPI0037172E4A